MPGRSGKKLLRTALVRMVAQRSGRSTGQHRPILRGHALPRPMKAALLAIAACLMACGAARSDVASYYGGRHHGRATASGEKFNQHAMTAAHRTLPFGTRLRVSYGSRSVVVRINDRGPFIRGRTLDLSAGAARALGMLGKGVARVSTQRM
jgi:rare lipoprotein A (peptidoglycan hydrolase)